ncbi:MAG: efflux RND transporter periplasmic adaptor subunit [Acidobacteria bacterium]|nr:efflux RND transporter periplasmic adaptor subunit [Acidobacteriota bacterium]
MKRYILIVGGLALGAGLVYYARRSDPPEARAAAVRRVSLVQLLTTNGKVEPLEGYDVHVRVPLLVERVEVKEGDQVRRGQDLAVVDDSAARAALAQAQAQLEIARADQALLERGGSAAEVADLEAAIVRARMEQEAAQKEIASLQRLVERKAAPRVELEEHRQRFYRAQAQLNALERKRSAFLGPEDRQRVQARIRQAEAAVAQATNNLRFTAIRAPVDGTLYSLQLRPGGYYNSGELVAQIGALDKVRVRLLVDEPELGRVRVGQAVRITWDGLPGLSWQGSVQRLPSEVEAIGARSVGEVLCTINNPERRLLPNVTVNVEIVTGAAANALAVPREAVLRQGDKTYVLLADARGFIARQPVKLGIYDATRVQVLDGLREDQVVILPGDRAFFPGQRVRPEVQQ